MSKAQNVVWVAPEVASPAQKVVLTDEEKMAKQSLKMKSELIKSFKNQSTMVLIYGWKRPKMLEAGLRSLRATIDQILTSIEPELPMPE